MGPPTNQDGTADDGRPASSKRSVEHNRQCLVCDDVAEQQGDENPVLALLEEAKHAGGVFLLRTVARGSKDLEIDLVLAHEARLRRALALVRLENKTATRVRREQTHAIVKPAKTPPSSTRAMATPR